MFSSLYKVQINWIVFFITILLVRLLFPTMSWYSYFAVVISLHQFFLLFYSLNFIIPIRYISGMLMCMQMLIGPVLAYNGIDQYQPDIYQMKIPEAEYFQYIIPAVSLFILGLHFKAGKLQGEVLDFKSINLYANENSYIAYIFIGIGFFASVISEVFLTSGVRFIFYLISNFKFIGAFLIIFSTHKLKILPLILVVASIISSSLLGGLFHDLLTWLILLGAALAIRYKPSSFFKVIFLVSFILLTIIIQQLKSGYRSAISSNRKEEGLVTFTETYEQSKSSNELFNLPTLAKSSVRINQGFIITNIMKKVPDRVPFSNGSQLKLILEAAFLPRILAPDKLAAGDQEIFTKYSGIQLSRGTTMALSSVGDAYLNFGILGGSIFMFLLGLLYNVVLKVFYKYSINLPILLLFTTIVFYFPIRPDSEFQTNLGHLVKSCFLIFIIFTFWKQKFQLRFNSSN